jgi:hypothetical protein
MNSATSTESGPAAAGRPAARRDTGFQSWHFFIPIAMIAATVAVMLSDFTHPAALLLLSASVVAAGFVGVAMHHALSGFAGTRLSEGEPLSERRRDAIEREKALTLRSIKELEFDKAMGKVSDADFKEVGGRLRAKAIALMQELDREPAAVEQPAATAVVAAAAAAPSTPSGACAACGTSNDADARFCKQCGAKVGAHA